MAKSVQKAGFFGGWSVESFLAISPLIPKGTDVPNYLNQSLIDSQFKGAPISPMVTKDHLVAVPAKMRRYYNYGVRHYSKGLPIDKVYDFSLSPEKQSLALAAAFSDFKISYASELLSQYSSELQELEFNQAHLSILLQISKTAAFFSPIKYIDDEITRVNPSTLLVADDGSISTKIYEEDSPVYAITKSISGIHEIDYTVAPLADQALVDLTNASNNYQAAKSLTEAKQEDIDAIGPYVDSLTIDVSFLSYSLPDPAYITYEFIDRKYGFDPVSGLVNYIGREGSNIYLEGYSIDGADLLVSFKDVNQVTEVEELFEERFSYYGQVPTYHAIYTITGDTKERYWVYSTEEVDHPELNRDPTFPTTPNDYYPITHIRSNGVYLLDQKEDPSLIKEASDLLRIFDLTLEKVKEEIDKNPDQQYLDDIFFFPCLAVDSPRSESIQYFIEYFRKIEVPEPIYAPPIFGHLSDPLVNIQLNTKVISIEEGEYNFSLYLTDITVDIIAGDLLEGRVGDTSVKVNLLVIPYIEYSHQHIEGYYTQVRVYNLEVGSTLWSHANHHVKSTLHDIDDGFVIPLCQTIVKELTVLESSYPLTDGLNFLIFVLIENYVSFWDSEFMSIFTLVLVLIVLIVLWILATVIPGLQFLLPFIALAFKAALIGLVINVVLLILEAILVPIIGQEAFDYFAIVVRVVVAVVLAFTGNVQGLINVINMISSVLVAIGQVLTTVASYMQTDLLEDTKEFLDGLSEQEDELLELNNLLYNGPALYDPMTKLLTLDASLTPSEWFAVHMPESINMAGVAKGYTEKYVDLALQLPKQRSIYI